LAPETANPRPLKNKIVVGVVDVIDVVLLVF